MPTLHEGLRWINQLPCTSDRAELGRTSARRLKEDETSILAFRPNMRCRFHSYSAAYEHMLTYLPYLDTDFRGIIPPSVEFNKR